MSEGNRGKPFKPEIAGPALVDAASYGDKYAVEKHGVSQRSLYNWRERLATDPTFASYFSVIAHIRMQEWGLAVPVALRELIDFARKFAESADPLDKESMALAIEGARTLAQIHYAGMVISAKLGAATGGGLGTPVGTLPPSSNSIVPDPPPDPPPGADEDQD